MRVEANASNSRAEFIEAWKLPISKESLMPNLSALDEWPGQVIAFFDMMYRRIQSQCWLNYLIGIVNFLAIPLSIYSRRPRRLLALIYCGVIIHGSILLTCTTTVCTPRNALPVDPIILVAGAILFDWILRLAVAWNSSVQGALDENVLKYNRLL